MDSPAAELSSVTVEYPATEDPATEDPVRALDEVSIEFPQNTSTAIVGRSGSGKSTMVAVLALLRSPSAGSVRIGGVDTSRLSPGEAARMRSTEVGIVFQAFHLEHSLTAAENVMLPWYFHSAGGSRREARRRATQLLETLGIGDLAERHPNQMSGGQRQRVAIARALFPEPTLFIADEPTGNLDEDTANDVANAILSLPSIMGTAVILVTHDKAVVARSDRLLRLTKGRVSEQV